MGVYDDTARQLDKLDGPAAVTFALRRVVPSTVRFARWDDARRTTWPGGPERTDDAVAILSRLDEPGKLAYLIIENETEPRRTALHELGVYQLLLAAEVLTQDDEPPVAAALVRLTGKSPSPRPSLGVPGAAGGRHEPEEILLANESASGTLDGVERGEVPVPVLGYVPLMDGGDDPAVASRWKRTCEAHEPDEGRRAFYRDVALIMAELTPGLVVWQNELRGWMMRKSALVEEWKDEGRQEGAVATKRSDLFDVLEARMQNAVPEPIRLAIEGTNSLDVLRAWIRAAATATNYPDFQRSMRQP